MPNLLLFLIPAPFPRGVQHGDHRADVLDPDPLRPLPRHPLAKGRHQELHLEAEHPRGQSDLSHHAHLHDRLAPRGG